MKAKEDGRAKLYVIREALACRRAHAPLFREGEYRPLETRGPWPNTSSGSRESRRRQSRSQSCPAYWPAAESKNHRSAKVTGATRSRLLVPPEAGPRLVNRLTGERLSVDRGALLLADVFASFPLALLVSEA